VIAEDLLSIVEERRELLEELKISRTCVSLCYTGVMLNNGYVGLCYTPKEDIDRPRTKWGFHNRKAVEIAKLIKSINIVERAVGVAALNALSQFLMDFQSYERRVGADVLDVIQLSKKEIVGIVGNMKPLVERVRRKVRKVYVFERNQRLRGDALPDTFVEEFLPGTDVVLISGSALVNGTLDRLLELSKNARVTAVVGPTASSLPEPFFEKGVQVLAGVRARGEQVMSAVAEGKSFRAFKRLVEKYVVENR
jgi:hypothetical protein